MQFNQETLFNVVLHTTNVCSANQVGAVKLHKVLYYLDMIHFAQHGTPFFGGSYKKRPYGPTCVELLKSLRVMENENLLEIDTVEYFGFRKKQYTPKKEANLGFLNEIQVSLLNEVVDFVCKNNSATTISEFSHNAAWEIAEFGDEIPYQSAFLIYPTDASEDALEWAALEENVNAIEESRKTSVEFVDFASFRSRVLEQHK